METEKQAEPALPVEIEDISEDHKPASRVLGREVSVLNPPPWRPKKFNANRKRIFLEHYSRHGRRQQAAAAAGIFYRTVRDHELADPIFAEQVRAAERHHADLIDSAIEQRGQHGFEEVTTIVKDGPDGNSTTTSVTRKASDRLLLARAAAMHPAYKRVAEQQQQVTVSVGVGLSLETMTPEAREHLRALLKESPAQPIESPEEPSEE